MIGIKSHVKCRQWKLFQKRDILLYLIILLFVVIVIFWGYPSLKGNTVLVSINGVVQYHFSLDDEGTKRIESNGKKLMDLLIADADMRIIDSQCPLHLCERGTLKQAGVLVCVPQEVIITIERQGEPVKQTDEIDLITG